jgi:ATP-dependent DNA ligase
MLLAELVEASAAVSATRARTGKVQALAGVLRRLDPDEVTAAVGILTGTPRQGRIGVGWRTVAEIDSMPAAGPMLTVGEVDAALSELAGTSGPGSAGRRLALLTRLLHRATPAEDDLLRRLLTGELRQGALAGLMVDAVARAAGVPAAAVRRAAMLSGDLGDTAQVALGAGEPGLADIGLQIMRPVQPMLASSAADVADALGRTGEASVEWKLDGARVQVHRDGAEVRVFTRNLNEVTHRLAVPRVETAEPSRAQAMLDQALETGHEGVVVKALGSSYEAGRRGGSWRKVKPVRTLDLVVLAAEWGHGRRRGWLSNLHLGAREPNGGFVMVGKTFKGLTDEVLAWQTAALLDREVRRDGITVHVRPELVVEVALDGVQTSTRYPGGVALRFARVRGYRPDKNPGEADTIGAVQALLAGT